MIRLQKVLSIAVLLVLILSSCTHKSAQNIATPSDDKAFPEPAARVGDFTNMVEAKDGDFIFRIKAKKSEYKLGEDVKVYGELEYVGKEDKVTIGRSATPIYFNIFEKTRNYKVDYAYASSYTTDVLVKGQPIVIEMGRGGGGFSDQDDQKYIQFIKDFWDKGFAVGEYEISGSAQFDLITDGIASDNNKKYNIPLKLTLNIEP